MARTNIARKPSSGSVIPPPKSDLPHEERLKRLVVNPNKMPFMRNKSSAPPIEAVITPIIPQNNEQAQVKQPAPLLNNGRIIMGSFGLKNNGMAKTAGGSSHMRFTSAGGVGGGPHQS